MLVASDHDDSSRALGPGRVALGANSSALPPGYARQAIRMERTLGWVLWLSLAAVLVLISL